MDHWLTILTRARQLFPRLRRVSCHSMARNVRDKSDAELATLCAAGLSLLYIGPESVDDTTLRRIAKGDSATAHVKAAVRAHTADMQLSGIALVGIASERWREHASATAELVTAMNPAFFSALTVTVVPGTPLATLSARGRFTVPDVPDLLRELRVMVSEAGGRAFWSEGVGQGEREPELAFRRRLRWRSRPQAMLGEEPRDRVGLGRGLEPLHDAAAGTGRDVDVKDVTEQPGPGFSSGLGCEDRVGASDGLVLLEERELHGRRLGLGERLRPAWRATSVRRGRRGTVHRLPSYWIRCGFAGKLAG